ncbi:MAG: T9SS type A sorting domain-containing protein [Paludibacteraceae bacterium]|jgi:hypothetical protein|nr:T9SS type A sorting domain-containing protein [Paludibacteraceae bacterium]MEE3484410.1 T9SS type A sorting domain-containing protein [Bacteroidales bacterium]
MTRLTRTFLVAASLLGPLYAGAIPEVKINGEAISPAPVQIKPNGDNVNVIFTDGSVLSFDMDEIIVEFKNSTHITSLQETLFVINSSVNNQLSLTGIDAGKKLSILSVTGITVYSGETQSGETSIDLSNLTSGLYLLNVEGLVVKFFKR